MAKANLQLVIISAEREVLREEVESVTAPTAMGEITILPGHVPLLSRLQIGELIYLQNNEEHSVVISQGFLDLAPGNELTIMVDVGTHARDISEEKAKQAVADAEKTLTSSADRRELLLAEASLKRAMLEIKVAQKTKKSTL